MSPNINYQLNQISYDENTFNSSFGFGIQAV